MDIYRAKKKGGASNAELLADIAAKRAGKVPSGTGSSAAVRSAHGRGQSPADEEAKPAESSGSRSEASSDAPSGSSGGFESADEGFQSAESEQNELGYDEEVTSKEVHGTGKQCFDNAGYEIPDAGSPGLLPADVSTSSPDTDHAILEASRGGSSPSVEMEAEVVVLHATKKAPKDEPKLQRMTLGPQIQKQAPRQLEQQKKQLNPAQAKDGSRVQDARARHGKAGTDAGAAKGKGPSKLVSYSDSSGSRATANASGMSVADITSRLAATTLEAAAVGRASEDSVGPERKPSGGRAARDQSGKHRHSAEEEVEEVEEVEQVVPVGRVVAGDWHVDDQLIIPHDIQSALYPHQKEGIAFLHRLHKEQKGGILGDDMGLGKTRQIASFLAGLIKSKIVRTVLLVVPTTLLPQWHEEFAAVGIKGCVEFSAQIPVPKRQGVLHEFKQGREGAVMLTTYEMAKGISGISWDYLVLDEGHLVKNPDTQRFKDLKSLSPKHCIILTGTPIQNKLKELWALYDMCHPNLLGDYKADFRPFFEHPINAGNEAEATKYQKRVGNLKSKALREKIKPYFLRRLKKDIFPTVRSSQPRRHIPGQPPPLPLKTDVVVWLSLSNRQSQVYEAFLETDTVRRVLEEAKGGHVLTAITALKKICDHPGLLKDGAIDEIKDALEGMEDKGNLADIQKHMEKILNNPEVLEDPKASCKLKFLDKLLKELLAKGHRVLVFSQSTVMLDMTEKCLKKASTQFLRIDGSVNPKDRERRVRRFQAGGGPAVFLLTTQVGGLGLTLHAADRVVLLDPSWNPSVDNQSVDRAYRLGQEKDVMVYRLITCETVEDKMYKRQVMKDGLIRSATSNQSNQLRYFSSKDVAELLSLPTKGFKCDKTLKLMEERHKGEIHLDEDIEEHLEFVKSLPSVIGLSHHDVLYTREDDESLDEPDFHEGTEMQPVGVYPGAQGSTQAKGTEGIRKPMNIMSTNRPSAPPGILQATKAGVALQGHAPAPAQRVSVPLPAAPNQGAINIAKAHAENADKDVAKLDIELLRCKNELAKRPDQDDEHSRKLKNRMAKKQEERDLAHDTAMLLKAKHEAMVNQVVHVLD